MSSEAAWGGRLFVLSAPSGAGKTTIVERVVRAVPGLRKSRSYTSRPARGGETDGVDYRFVSRGRFEAMAGAGEFLEWADVFGNLYGTHAGDTERVLSEGVDLVLVIDVQGARQVRAHRVPSVSIFVLPPSFAVLEARLRARGEDTEEQIRRRLDVARREVLAVPEYDYVVVNDDADGCADRVRAIVLAERSRRDRIAAAADAIARTFERAGGAR